MQKWEYLYLLANWDKRWYIRSMNDNDVPGKPSISQYLTSLGDQGWEMVTMQYDCNFNQFGQTQSEAYRIAMKRPKA